MKSFIKIMKKYFSSGKHLSFLEEELKTVKLERDALDSKIIILQKALIGEIKLNEIIEDLKSDIKEKEKLIDYYEKTLKNLLKNLETIEDDVLELQKNITLNQTPEKIDLNYTTLDEK
jgi:Trp operon repressor